MIPTTGSHGESMSLVDSEYDSEPEGDDAKEPSSPLAKREKRNKGDDSKNSDQQAILVQDWRYKLQKAFLSNKTPLKPEAMPELDQLFTIVENYSEMTIQQLQFSKIGKVMRHISLIPDGVISREDEFRFRVRATSLIEKWYGMVFANTSHRMPKSYAVPHVNKDT